VTDVGGMTADIVVVLGVWLAGGLLVAARGFRWEPRTAHG
jgi:hypothetical protein